MIIACAQALAGGLHAVFADIGLLANQGEKGVADPRYADAKDLESPWSAPVTDATSDPPTANS